MQSTPAKSLPQIAECINLMNSYLISPSISKIFFILFFLEKQTTYCYSIQKFNHIINICKHLTFLMNTFQVS